jgi:tellurite resistance protein TerC
MLFNVFVYFLYEEHWLGWTSQVGEALSGSEAAMQFLTGYILEKSLSVDNIFVIAMLFNYFRIPPREQHRVLFWGILGAIVMRGIMIALGAALIHRFTWTIYVFGALLIFSAIKMLMMNKDDLHPDRNLAVRLVRRWYPVVTQAPEGKFFVTVDGRRAVTTLFLSLILVETTDVMFAVDSIPAIFAVTRDPFLVFTSNIFAILGLRSLYFAMAGLMDKFRYLEISLVVLLMFVGVKMLISHHYPIRNEISLGVIAGILAIGVIASLIADSREKEEQQSTG